MAKRYESIHTGEDIDAAISLVKENKTFIPQIAYKYGGIAYEEGVLKLYDDAEHTTLLDSVALSGTSYSIKHNADTSTAFYMLAGDLTKAIKFSPTTMVYELGQSQGEPFVEDYEISLAVDTGNGQFVDRPLADPTIKDGQTYTLVIGSYVTIGSNRLRVTIRGLRSEQAKTVVYNCTVTTLALTSRFPWQTAWIEGNDVEITGIYFEGNMVKTLHVLIDGKVSYSKEFTAGERYTSAAYTFRGVQLPDSTGIHTMEMWMSGEGIETQHYKYNVMVVRAADIMTARLLCINDVQTAVNYSANKAVFQFALYGTDTATFNVIAKDSQKDYSVKVDDVVMGVQTQTVTKYPLSLEIESEETEGMQLVITGAADGGETVTVTTKVDNSNAYIATRGYDFYFKAANNSNKSANREQFINEANGKMYAIGSVDMMWNEKDGYCTDEDGHSCFRVLANSSAKVPITPLRETAARSRTVEFLYKASTIADYGKPIFTIMNTDEYSESSTVGLVLFPTRLVCLTTAQRSQDYQQVNLTENSINHIVLVFTTNYSGNGRNLCQCYVNGVSNFVFEYTGGFGDGEIVMGQDASDFSLYMYRTYTRALESNEVKDNFLNAMIETSERNRAEMREANDIMDGQTLTYSMAKARGYNCLVYETDQHLPDLENNTKGISGINLRIEYADHPEWNVKIENIPCDGQGTTSKKYRRWNLRNKIKSATFYYGWDEDSQTYSKKEEGKDGYIDGYERSPKVSKFTAKKNIASSMQGHKIGACGLYNDLWHRVIGWKDVLPSASCRVATKQYPFLGFQKYSDNRYEFIGLYTAGADKGNKKTFGYNETSAFPNLMMIEGPNHAPLATRFLCAWDDVVYDGDNETLTFGGEEGWDADIASGYDTAEDVNEVRALFESEFRPAYEFVFFTSPYLVTTSEIGKSIDEINADVATFRSGHSMLDAATWSYDVSHKLVSVVDEHGALYAYSNATKNFKKVEGHNVFDYLGLSAGAAGNELRSARSLKFLSEVDKYISISEARFHWCYRMLIGATDNDAKNSYWRKFKAVADGGKWGFNQDDLDTILDRDNNGQGTKKYNVEPSDYLATGDEVFQGSSSAFWRHFELADVDGLKTMMRTIISEMVSMATEQGLPGNTRERVYKIMGEYFWANSSQYFPMAAYNEDTKWAYVDVWAKKPTAVYNNVPPLTQAGGDQLEGEKLWLMRRIDYIMSKYHIGAFNGSDADGLGTIEFTPASPFTFNVKPAIEIYPTISIGGAESTQGKRTKADEVCQLVAESDGATTCYLKNVDLLSELGDLSGLKLASRGGGTDISFDVRSKRLRSVKVGDANTADVSANGFNAVTLAVAGDAVEVVDASNVSSLSGNIDLQQCPRLRETYFGGTNISRLMLPVGSKLEKLSLPSSVTTLFLHSLNKLKEEGAQIAGYGNIDTLYINRCRGINPMDILKKVLAIAGNKLQFLSLSWDADIQGDTTDLSALAKIAANLYINNEDGNGYANVTYNEEVGTLMPDYSLPAIQGSITADAAYEDDVNRLRNTFPALVLNILQYYVRFKDDEVRKVLGKNVKGDENANLTLNELAAVKDVKQWFRNNKSVKYFDEFALTSVSKVDSVTFQNCTLLHLSTPECLTVFPQGFIGNQYSSTRITRLNSTVEGMINTGAVKTIAAGGSLGTSLGTLGKVIFAPLVEEAGESCVAQNALCRAVFFPNVRKIGLSDIGAYNRHLVYDNKELRILDIGVHELTDSRSLCCHSNLIMRSFVVPKAEHLNETNVNQGAVIYVPSGFMDDYKKAENWSVNAGRIYAIGGSHWQAYMQQLAKEEGKAFDDYSLRYIDYDIYGVDYATDELNALTLSIPDEYLGKDGETFVFDTVPLAIGYDPEPTRKEYFTLSKSGSDGVSVADTEARFIKMLTMDAVNAGSLHDVTFTAVSSQVEGVKAVRTFKCAYPLISAVNLSFSNQFVSAALESNTDNARYTQLEYSADGGVGVSDNGWVYANAHGEAASGTVTVRSKTTPSSASSIEVAVSADAVQRQFFADAEVERVILSKKVGNKGNVISEDDFRNLTDITDWFKGNKAITSFNELCNIKSVRILRAFVDCSSLESVCFDGMTLVDAMNEAFLRCKALKSVDFSKAKISKPGTNSMYKMFYDCYALERVNFRGMDATTIDNLCETFKWCVGLKYVDLGDLDTSNCGPKYALDGIFKECRKIESLKLGAPFFNFYKKVEASTEVFKDLDSWVNDDEIAAVLSCLPDLTSLNLSRTLYFSANTFAHITQTQIEEALAKGWTITK